MKELEQSKIESRREIHIPINLKGLYDGYTKIFFHAPVDAFDWLTRKTESFSKKITYTGVFSALSFPLSIMVRNGATVANDTLNSESGGRRRGGKYEGWGIFGAICGAGAATWFAGAAIFANLGAVSSVVGSVGAAVVAGVLAAPVIAPALAAGMILTGVVMGAGAFGLSLVPAVANIKVGITRTWDSIRGVKYTPEMKKQLAEEASKDSISSDYEAHKLSEASSAVSNLPEANQIKIYENLKEKFQAALDKKAAAEAATAVAAPAATDAPKP